MEIRRQTQAELFAIEDAFVDELIKFVRNLPRDMSKRDLKRILTDHLHFAWFDQSLYEHYKKIMMSEYFRKL